MHPYSSLIPLLLLLLLLEAPAVAAEPDRSYGKPSETEQEESPNDAPTNPMESRDIDEMVLTMSYPSVGRVYITALYDYDTNTFMLPVIEIFERLEINYRADGPRGLVQGVFLTGGEPYRMNFADHTVTLGGQTFTFDADRMLVGATDYFVDPSVFEEAFGMRFDVNMGTLSARLTTDNAMPVTDRRNRERRRRDMERRAFEREFKPLYGPRAHAVLGGGFIDYQLSTTGLVNDYSPNLSYALTGAGEVFGGALQGNLIGNYTEGGVFAYRTDNLRWRYGLQPNSYLTEIQAGQISTRGPMSTRIRGAAITNDPIEARQLYGTYVVEGQTEADAEVELYLNNNIIDFTTADQLGYYRFEVPLRYGTSAMQIRIITPDGRLQVRDREVIVPFQFLPRGTVGYRAEGGVTEPNSGLDGEQGLALHSDVGYGFTNWLTARVGVDYNDTDSSDPLLYSSASMRVLGSYLINAEAVPGAFYRVQSGIVFPSSHSINVNYTRFEGESRFNRRGARQQLAIGAYSPLRFINSGIRAGIDATQFDTNTQARLTGDFFTRLGRVNLRFNYRQQLTMRNGDTQFTGGTLRGSATYSLSRNGNVPRPFRGTFVRASGLYDIEREEVRQIDLQLSRGIARSGRFTFGVSRIIPNNQTVIQAGLNLDLGGRMRSSTDYRSRQGSHSYRQTLRGSVGVDTRHRYMQLNDRQQAGRSAATVTLFVDNSGSGTYEPENGDEILPYNAVRLDRSSQASVGSDGRIRLTSLQSFYRYNLEVNRNRIPNPMLVPGREAFSFITDPNNYTTIEIPFYRTGVIDGQVVEQRGQERTGRGGLRLFLNGTDNGFSETIRTFHGGGFYAMDIPPGSYTLQVDPTQLDFLGMVARDGALAFTVEQQATGHFIDGLEIVLVEPGEEALPEIEDEDIDINKDAILAGILADYQRAFNLFTTAQQQLFDGRFNEARSSIERSIALFESDYALALKGSVEYMLGNRSDALRLWNEARDRNSSIEIPDVDLLDSILENNSNR